MLAAVTIAVVILSVTVLALAGELIVQRHLDRAGAAALSAAVIDPRAVLAEAP